VEESGPCPVFASFTLAFALQMRKKHRKTSVRVRKTSVSLIKTSVRVEYTYYQNTHTNTQITKPTHTHIRFLRKIRLVRRKMPYTSSFCIQTHERHVKSIMFIVRNQTVRM